MWITLAILTAVALLVAIYDVSQRGHTILRNFPIVGHFRYWLELVGPELRQYIVTNNDEERPFNRDQRRWVYASAKKQNNYFGFGSDNEMELVDNYVIIKHSEFPLPAPAPGTPGYDPEYRIPCAKVIGGFRDRAKKFRPASVVNISGMSYGSLSSAAVEAINRGCEIAGCWQNTGEGSICSHHRHGGDLIWQIGTGYFGCREADGSFSLPKLVDNVAANPQVRAIEIKLSQGAKPGLGGIVPAAKITPEIAEIRGIPMGVDCVSPPGHRAFHDPDSMLDFIESVADETGLPVGIKAAVGDIGFWKTVTGLINKTGRSMDFVTIDGGEGGTGAAPLVFADHVSLPFKVGFSRVYKVFTDAGLNEKLAFIGSGKLGFPQTALMAMGLGCDLISVGREALMAIGCIQAQRCHTGHCPAGICTHNKWLVRGLDPTLKSARLANYVITLRRELMYLSRACGVYHPALIGAERLEVLDGRFGGTTLADVFGYDPGMGRPSAEDAEAVGVVMAELTAPGTSA